MDLLEHFGFRGCFFVDVLMEYQHGQRALERTIEAIAERGHEIQLHVHADHLEWSSDRHLVELSGALGQRDLDVFRRVMELSIDLFECRVGHRPIAYRAGGFRIADAHFPVLEELGICIDSSVQPYYNSRVSDWMRTRTQPFWVGDVLEIPPTFFLLDDDPDAWDTRGFQPSPGLGDPLSALSRGPGGPPHVATYVSHSFQLLRCRQTAEPGAIESFAERLRSTLPAAVADRLLRAPMKDVRAYGAEVDDHLVTPLAGILRRVADRPDARCATYAEVLEVIDRFWPHERHPLVDPIPIHNRRRGTSRVTGTRIFDRGFLVHLTHREPPSSHNGEGADPTWLEGLEWDGVTKFSDGVRSAIRKLPRGELLRLRLRTLGIGPSARRAGLPPLAELLFPAVALHAVAADGDSEDWGAVPWDAPTFRAWLEDYGFELVSERRLPRSPEELAAIDRFKEKLRWFDPLELRTAAVDMELSPGNFRESGRSTPPPAERPVDEPGLRLAKLEPALLSEAAGDLYKSMHPGQELELEIPPAPPLASRTTILLALMRSGLEVLGSHGISYRLVRPVELVDIERFAGRR